MMDLWCRGEIDLLGVANFDGYFTRLNPAFERVLGFTPAELTAQPFLDFVHPDDRATTISKPPCGLQPISPNGLKKT
jgi:PAS domain-containing protein